MNGLSEEELNGMRREVDRELGLDEPDTPTETDETVPGRTPIARDPAEAGNTPYSEGTPVTHPSPITNAVSDQQFGEWTRRTNRNTGTQTWLRNGVVDENGPESLRIMERANAGLSPYRQYAFLDQHERERQDRARNDVRIGMYSAIGDTLASMRKGDVKQAQNGDYYVGAEIHGDALKRLNDDSGNAGWNNTVDSIFVRQRTDKDGKPLKGTMPEFVISGTKDGRITANGQRTTKVMTAPQVAQNLAKAYLKSGMSESEAHNATVATLGMNPLDWKDVRGNTAEDAAKNRMMEMKAQEYAFEMGKAVIGSVLSGVGQGGISAKAVREAVASQPRAGYAAVIDPKFMGNFVETRKISKAEGDETTTFFNMKAWSKAVEQIGKWFSNDETVDTAAKEAQFDKPTESVEYQIATRMNAIWNMFPDLRKYYDSEQELSSAMYTQYVNAMQIPTANAGVPAAQPAQPAPQPSPTAKPVQEQPTKQEILAELERRKQAKQAAK